MVEKRKKGDSPRATQKLSAADISEIEKMAKPNAYRGQALVEIITSEGSKLKPCNEDSRELEGPCPI